jgi:hypothetical protein
MADTGRERHNQRANSSSAAKTHLIGEWVP